MNRMFLRHKIRKFDELAGLWDFYTVDEDKSGKYVCKLMVPGCWESHPELCTYRGRGVYSRRIQVSQDSNIRLVFAGVSHTANIYFDGTHVAHHYNAYTPFEAIIPRVSAGEHVIEVHVDNRFTEDSVLHIPNDYYTYGGIIRPVTLEYVPDIFIERLTCTPFYREGMWHLTVEAELQNLSGETCPVSLHAKIAGQNFSLGEAAVDGCIKMKEKLALPGVTAWSIENPVLYLVEICLENGDGTIVDDLIERMGFREIKVVGDQILLNGNRIFIKGYNRHEDHPSLGCSLSVQEMNYDLDLVLASNANAVRTCHYPNDERFLDLCDEKGILIWEESHARGLSEKYMRHPNFRRQSLDCIEEMVKNHINHPSIILWGILNECASEVAYGRECYVEQIGLIKSLDASRPTTFATNKCYKDICLDLADVVSFNIYPLWYCDQSPDELCENLKAWIDTTEGRGKPLIFSGFGAGAVYGYRTPTNVKWSEERQAKIVGSCIEQLACKPYLSGLIIWQFCDCRVTEEVWALSRPKTQNNKGIFDIYRRPKIAFGVVKELFSKI